jgi:trk system potassium uptake protein TrkH
MHYSLISRILGVLLMVFSLTLLPPMVVSLIYDDGSMRGFVLAFIIIFISGFVLWFPVRKYRQEMRTRDGFFITVLFWVVLGLVGAVPFFLSEHPTLSLTDSVFESLSGLTTTGATVIAGLDDLPKSILYYRQQLQWFGGIGIIVIAVAILPMLGIGGMQLYRAETPGPVKDSKLTPRITETAKSLFLIYLGLTVACMVAYWLAGMSVFDAIAHSFSTVAIGGFSTHDASLGYFDSPAVMWVAVVFMLIAGMNFALHFLAWSNTSISHYVRDPELKFYLFMIIMAALLTCASLYFTGTYNLNDSILHGIFQVVSITTTTGYATANFSAWPTFLPFMLIFLAFMGGCAGSTAGGMKVIRVLLVLKQGVREIYRLIHPSAVFQIKLRDKVVSERVVEAVWGFLSVYILTFVVMLLALQATGIDPDTAFTAVGACINNLGPGLGGVAENYADINAASKWVLCFAMLLGRLEIFTLLVLFTPMFWRS